ARRVWATTDAADRRVENTRACFDSGEAVRVTVVARVVPVEAGCAGLRDERTNGRRRGDADRVRKDDVRPAGEARCELDDDAGIDMSFEGTAEADGNRHRMGILPTGCQDGLGGGGRLGQAHVPVRLVE